MKIDGFAGKALHEMACMMIEHYELPLYHPVYRQDVKHKLLQYAHKEGLLEFVQGYVARANQTLDNVVYKV